MIAYRKLDTRILIINDLGETWLYWDLTDKQMKHLDKKIQAFSCFRSYDLCELHLSRPHLTCLTCELRKVIQGSMETFYQIHIHQLLLTKPPSHLKSKILSLMETISKL